MMGHSLCWPNNCPNVEIFIAVSSANIRSYIWCKTDRLQKNPNFEDLTFCNAKILATKKRNDSLPLLGKGCSSLQRECLQPLIALQQHINTCIVQCTYMCYYTIHPYIRGLREQLMNASIYSLAPSLSARQPQYQQENGAKKKQMGKCCGCSRTLRNWIFWHIIYKFN